MALMEEFIQMKVNGDDTSSAEKKDTTIRGPFSNPEDEYANRSNVNEIATPRKLQPSDALGYFALSKVKSLARSAGTGIREQGDDGTSSRAEFLDWQRHNLREVRKEVGTLDVGGEVRSTLIKALPTNRKQSGNEGECNGGRGSKSGMVAKQLDKSTVIQMILQPYQQPCKRWNETCPSLIIWPHCNHS
jgi:hypothetical protein